MKQQNHPLDGYWSIRQIAEHFNTSSQAVNKWSLPEPDLVDLRVGRMWFENTILQWHEQVIAGALKKTKAANQNNKPLA